MAKFIDSNVIIYAFTNSEYKEKCRDIIRKENITINALILTEAFSKIQTITGRQAAADAVKALYKIENVTVKPLDQNLFFEALKRAEKYELHVSDLVHYTTALLENCTEMISYDKHFDNLEIKRTTP